MNPDNAPERIMNRLWLLYSIQEDKTGMRTYSELMERNDLSSHVLTDHLKFLVKKRYLFAKRGVYRINPDYEEDLRLIDSDISSYLGFSMKKVGRRAFNRFHRSARWRTEYDHRIKQFEDAVGKRIRMEL